MQKIGGNPAENITYDLKVVTLRYCNVTRAKLESNSARSLGGVFATIKLQLLHKENAMQMSIH